MGPTRLWGLTDQAMLKTREGCEDQSVRRSHLGGHLGNMPRGEAGCRKAIHTTASRGGTWAMNFLTFLARTRWLTAVCALRDTPTRSVGMYSVRQYPHAIQGKTNILCKARGTQINAGEFLRLHISQSDRATLTYHAGK